IELPDGARVTRTDGGDRLSRDRPGARARVRLPVDGLGRLRRRLSHDADADLRWHEPALGGGDAAAEPALPASAADDQARDRQIGQRRLRQSAGTARKRVDCFGVIVALVTGTTGRIPDSSGVNRTTTETGPSEFPPPLR